MGELTGERVYVCCDPISFESYRVLICTGLPVNVFVVTMTSLFVA